MGQQWWTYYMERRIWRENTHYTGHHFNEGCLAAQVSETDVLVTGGAHPGTGATSAAVFKVCVIEETIEEAPSLITPRRRHACLVLEGSPIVIGGYQASSNALASCERFAENHWLPIADLNRNRSDHGACVFRERHMYVFAGQNKKFEYLDTIERYTSPVDEWVLLKIKYPLKVCGLTAVNIMNEEIFCCGGVKADRIRVQFIPEKKRI